MARPRVQKKLSFGRVGSASYSLSTESQSRPYGRNFSEKKCFVVYSPAIPEGGKHSLPRPCRYGAWFVSRLLFPASVWRAPSGHRRRNRVPAPPRCSAQPESGGKDFQRGALLSAAQHTAERGNYPAAGGRVIKQFTFLQRLFSLFCGAISALTSHHLPFPYRPPAGAAPCAFGRCPGRYTPCSRSQGPPLWPAGHGYPVWKGR